MVPSDIVLDDEAVDVLGRVTVRPSDSDAGGVVRIFPGRGNVRVGGSGAEGDLVVQTGDDENRIHLDGGGNNWDSPASVYANQFGTLRLGVEDNNGRFLVRDQAGTNRVLIFGGVEAGTPDDDGGDDGDGGPPKPPDETGPTPDVDVPLITDDLAEPGPLRVQIDGQNATLTLGGDGQGGDLVLGNPENDPETGPRVHLNSNPDTDTRLNVLGDDGETIMSLSSNGTLEVGDTLVANGTDLVARIRELEDRVAELEG